MYTFQKSSHSVQDAALLAKEKCLCLFPVTCGYVVRHALVLLLTTVTKMEKHLVSNSKATTPVVQHEIDHINTVLFYDRTNEKDSYSVKDGLLILE